ncbi:YigZ family protein [Kocuria rhizophila]|nr:YigZ family protein [Kocuria rhizophila]
MSSRPIPERPGPSSPPGLLHDPAVRSSAHRGARDQEVTVSWPCWPAWTRRTRRPAVAEVTAQHRDARHHCTAFVLGPTGHHTFLGRPGAPQAPRASPCCRPSRSSRPRSSGLRRRRETSADVCAVVVRWLGGVELSAPGGLVRAYSGAVTAALETAPWPTAPLPGTGAAAAPHAEAGRIEAELRSGLHHAPHRLRRRPRHPAPCSYQPSLPDRTGHEDLAAATYGHAEVRREPSGGGQVPGLTGRTVREVPHAGWGAGLF